MRRKLLWIPILFFVLWVPAQAEDATPDVPLIELYPYPVWYQRDPSLGGSDDQLVVLDPASGQLSRFTQLQFLLYPKFHTETLGGTPRLRLEGYDLSKTFFKRWYLEPATGKVSVVKSPAGDAKPDHFRWCHGKQNPQWFAIPQKSEAGYGLTIGPNTTDPERLSREEFEGPFPAMKFSWRVCEHQDWVIAHNRQTVAFLHVPSRQFFTGSFVGSMQHFIIRQDKIWFWTTGVNDATPGIKPYALSYFDFNMRQWHPRILERRLPFLPLQDFNENTLLLGPPWLPTDYAAPFFKLNTVSAQISAPIQVHNLGPGRIKDVAAVFKQLNTPF